MSINDLVRRSQLIVPFGIGSMIELPNETLMTAGLDFWPSESYSSDPQKTNAIINNTIIRDERLELRLSKLFKTKINHFLSPTEGIPVHSKRQKLDYHDPMRFVRFPTWLFCPRCKVLKKTHPHTKEPPKCDNPYNLRKESKGRPCSEKKLRERETFKPVGFVIACKSGHIDDFPWIEWVHQNQNNDCNGGSGDLFLTTTGASGLMGTRVSCRLCGASESLIGAGTPKSLQKVLYGNRCSGKKPWLGANAPNDDCTDPDGPRMMVRGSLSVYISNTISSILIPPYSNTIRTLLNKNRDLWEGISDTIDDNMTLIEGNYELNDSGFNYIKKRAEKFGFEIKSFVETALAKFNSEERNINTADISEEEFRFKEYLAFTGERPSSQDRNDFDIINCDLNDYEPWVCKYFKKIVRVEKLRETRVFTGFSRVSPCAPGEEKVKIYRKKKNWLPAMEVKGEGIFIEFNNDKLSDWEGFSRQINSSDSLNNKLKLAKKAGKPNFPRKEKVTNKFLLAHTFAHLLIRQLAFDCGYDAASLKERLFVDKSEKQEMCAILIYTASGDSEGSLGGLVERARPSLIENTIRSAILQSNFCSNDPICHELDHQGLEGYNISACHACSLIPETSCDHANLLLDRRVIIGTFENPELGYFSELVN